MIAERAERFFEERYQRAPERHLQTARRFTAILTLAVVSATTPLFASYLDASRTELIRTFIVVTGITVIGGSLLLMPAWKRSHHEVEAWLAGDRGHEQTQRAWESARGFPLSGVRKGARVGIVAMGLPGVVYTVFEYDLSISGALGIFIAIVLAAALTAIIGWPVVDGYLMPLRRDLASHLPAPATVERVRLPLAGRLTGSVSVIGLLTGAAVAVVATFGERSIDEMSLLLVVTMVVGLGSGFLFASLMIRSLLAPLGELVRVTDEVSRGHTSARALVTTDDEIGLLSTSFNGMLDQLQAALDEVRASRARIVAASDAERQRIERNIHDGAQQQLTALALQHAMIRDQIISDPARAARSLDEASGRLRDALTELRELAQGLHPTVLTSDGLAPALELLAERAPIPVTVAAPADRFDEAIESTAWFVASEALANVAKHGHASTATIELQQIDGTVVLEIVDDGVGGATLGAGTGLAGLADRVAAVGGHLAVESPAGGGTTIRVEMPAAATHQG